MYATNLTQGYYSPEGQVYLWNGPGYPMILAPFISLNIPLLAAKLLNALFMFGAVIYFYATIRLYSGVRAAILFTYILGLYFPLYRYLHLLLTEYLTIFLVCGFIYHFCKLHQPSRTSRLHLAMASVYMGYLALTKIFFGFVILSCLMIYAIIYIIYRRSVFRKSFAMYMIAILLCVPYLLYTYSLTGKVFYWGNSGGLSLYWMSTPYDREYGDWLWPKKMSENPVLFKNHHEFFKETEALPDIKRDEAFKRKALENIRQDPVKYARNWFANIGRLLFNYPYSYQTQKMSTYVYIIPNMFLVVIFLLSLVPAYIQRTEIPYEIYGVMMLGFVVFTGSSLLSAYNRQFYPVVPMIIFWFAIIFSRVVKVGIRCPETN